VAEETGSAVVPHNTPPAPVDRDRGGSISPYASQNNFLAAQRMAIALSKSGMVPEDFQGNVANCLIAMELSNRVGASVFAVMQSLYIVHGKPAFEARFKIASVNKSGRFSAIRYEAEGTNPGWDRKNQRPIDPNYRIRAYATELASGEKLAGDWVSWDLVMAEGWHTNKDRNGRERSKWQTMPGKMFRYRAGSWWVDIYAPDISMGMMSAEETQEAEWHIEPQPSPDPQQLQRLRAKYNAGDEPAEPDPVPRGVDVRTGEVMDEPEFDPDTFDPTRGELPL